MLIGTYNLWLVLASLLIAVFASYTALDMAGRVSESIGSAARWWLLGGSVAMGIGIWSMHFVGMLAFTLPVPMGYNPSITLLSLIIAIASSAFALWTVCKQRLTRPRLAVGALVMGAGVSAMHYAGMAAMEMDPPIHYIRSLFILSVIIAISASGAALWISFHLRERSSRTKGLRAAAAVVMGIAIAGMHYTGMAAAQFPKGSVCTMSHDGASSSWLAPLIIVLALAVLSIALIISVLDFRATVLTSSLAAAHQELEFLATHDGLTKLPNRILLEDRLAHEIENTRRNHTSFSLYFIDLDGFKQINDAYGHHVGDRLLIEVAERIRSAVRARDTIARIGGDEFILLTDASEISDAAGLAGKLIVAMQKPIAICGHICQVSASIGIALHKEGADGPALLKDADAAMYHAKNMGRNTYCFFDASMNEDAQKQLQLLHDLRLALPRRELVLYYQPKIDALSGECLGAEALVRWNHPQRGLLSPAEFIPLAEKVGLIHSIGEWTLQEACRQMSEWRASDHHRLSVAVNLSAAQFSHPELIGFVQQSLDSYSLEPDSLVLEITESTAMRDPEASLAILQKLRQIGVRISIDDFGTGYSSLLYLKRLPAGELKIDRGFVRDLANGSEDAAIIAAIVALGRTLNLEIVAEGVETPEQQSYLTSLGCTSLQGFLLGRPMPPEQLIAKIAGRNAVQDMRDSAQRQRPKLVARIPSSVLA